VKGKTVSVQNSGITPNFFIFIASFLNWTELLDTADDQLFNFDVKT